MFNSIGRKKEDKSQERVDQKEKYQEQKYTGSRKRWKGKKAHGCKDVDEMKRHRSEREIF